MRGMLIFVLLSEVVFALEELSPPEVEIEVVILPFWAAWAVLLALIVLILVVLAYIWLN